MKKFILGISVFAIVLITIKAIISLPIWFSFTGESTNYYGVDTSKNKIILVGSSNLDHNYDYSQLNEAYTDRDVIGCYLNEPSGLYATIHKLKNLQSGSEDILIFCLPHSLYEEAKFLPLRTHKKLGFSKALLKNSMKEFPFRTLKSINSTTLKDCYSLLTKKRDSTSTLQSNRAIHFDKSPVIQADSSYQNCWVNDEGQFHIKSTSFDNEYLTEMKAYLESSFEGQVLFRFPAIRTNDYELNSERIFLLEHDFPFINNLSSSIYTNEYWFNQWYHLNKCGKDLNTGKLIVELNSYLSEHDRAANSK